jgi:hypothetical protein
MRRNKMEKFNPLLILQQQQVTHHPVITGIVLAHTFETYKRRMEEKEVHEIRRMNSWRDKLKYLFKGSVKEEK